MSTTLTIRKNHISMICIIVLALTGTVAATLEEDEKECGEQLTNLAACIPYVSGTAKQPTKECCDDTTKLKAAKPKCLCVLIKESADPSMGLPINTTLALQMPAACNIDAKISDCPKLLNIPVDSPDAKIFKDSSGTESTTAPTSDHSSSSAAASSSATPSAAAAASDNTTKTTTTTSSSNNGAKVSTTILLVLGLAYSISLFLI